MNATLKTFFVATLGAVGLHVYAGALYWQIGEDIASSYAGADYAVLRVTSAAVGSDVKVLDDATSADQKLSLYYLGGVVPDTDVKVSVDSISYAGATAAAGAATVEKLAQSDITGITDRNFLIEIFTASDTVVARSGIVNYASISGYVHEGLTMEGSILSSGIWSPTDFTAVPEPTSGLLFLIGGALLGLRRKKRA